MQYVSHRCSSSTMFVRTAIDRLKTVLLIQNVGSYVLHSNTEQRIMYNGHTLLLIPFLLSMANNGSNGEVCLSIVIMFSAIS